MSETKEENDYIFCEHCQKEHHKYLSWYSDFEWYCDQCYRKYVLKRKEVNNENHTNNNRRSVSN